MKLTERQESVLNEAGKLLVSADFVDIADGKLTQDGRGAMWNILLQKFEKEILKAAADVIATREAAELLRNAKQVIANS